MGVYRGWSGQARLAEVARYAKAVQVAVSVGVYRTPLVLYVPKTGGACGAGTGTRGPDRRDHYALGARAVGTLAGAASRGAWAQGLCAS